MAPPSGTITFLFTDIEGSTQLWQRHPNAMPAALGRHHALLQAAIATHSGYVFQVVGDAFCAAFDRPAAALAAALAAQRGLRDETWGATGAIRVRMALHTGTAPVEPGAYRSGEYLSGITLSRAARLLSAAYGGQILVSAATAELLRDQLPQDASLTDMGEHRLKDLIRPEHLYQVGAPDLESSFPPLRTLERHRHNLPVQRTRLIGRETQLAEIGALVGAESLVTLVGAGGTGKTRLALQVAAEQVERFADGVFWFALESIGEPALVLPTLADTLGVREQPGIDLQRTLSEYLRGRQILLLLDNFEQVAAAAPLLSELLAAAPRLKLLITSRSVLKLYGEVSYAVAPLPLPDLGQLALPALRQNESVALFVERARAVQAAFNLTEDNAPAIVEICRQLDGLPLGLELAAVRTRVLSPQQIIGQLQRRFELLTGGPRDRPSRHQTMRAAIDWGYHLLTAYEQRLFRRLAVFSGGCRLEAVEAVIGDEAAVLDGLTALVDQSLLEVRGGPAGAARFTLLVTLREYAVEQLEANGEAATYQLRQAEYFVALAERMDERLLPGPDKEVSLALLDEEHDNLRAALAWLIRSGNAQLAATLCSDLRWFWEVQGYQREARTWFDAVVALATDVPIALRARLLYEGSVVSWYAGDFDTARQRAEQCIAISRDLGPDSVDPWLQINLSRINIEAGEYNQALPAIQEALAAARRSGSADALLAAWALRGEVDLAQHDYAAARQACEEALAISTSVEPAFFFISIVLRQLGEVCQGEHDETAAWAWLMQSLARNQANHPPRVVSLTLAVMAGVLATWPGRPPDDRLRAARLWGAVSALHEAGGVSYPRYARERAERQMAAARASSDPIAWEQAWAEGRKLTLTEAMAEARRPLMSN